MTEDERRNIVISLTRLVRQMGWEELIEVQITPEDAANGQVDPRLVREMVSQLAKVVRDLAAVEMELLTFAGEVETIDFKPDVSDLKTYDEQAAPRFERGLHLDREQFRDRHKILVDLHLNLLNLEDALERG